MAAVDSNPPLAVEKVQSKSGFSGSSPWAAPVAWASPRKSGQEVGMGDWRFGIRDCGFGIEDRETAAEEPERVTADGDTGAGGGAETGGVGRHPPITQSQQSNGKQ